MTHCGIEKFASALKTLEIDTNIQLVSAEDELTERQNLGSSGVHVITEGSMTEDDYFSGKHDLVANEVILPEVHLSQPEQMPQDLQHLQASVISQVGNYGSYCIYSSIRCTSFRANKPP